MENNKDLSMCFTAYIIYNENEKKFEPLRTGNLFFGPPSHLQKEEYTSSDFIANQHNCVTSSSRFFVNYPDLFQKYMEEFPYSDWPMNFELSLRGKIEYLQYPSYVYRVHTNSLTYPSETKDNNSNSQENWLSERRKTLNERKRQYLEPQNLN